MQLKYSQKDEILKEYNNLKNFKAVSEKLKIPKTTVFRVVKNFEKRKNLFRKSGSGRKKSLDVSEIEKIDKKINQNPKMTSTDIKKVLDLSVSPRTIRNYLGNLGYKSKKPLRKPKLSIPHMVSRKNWGLININKSEEEWGRVLWSDESKFMLYPDGGVKRVYIKPGEELKKGAYVETRKFGGGSVMVWGCFSAAGVGNLVFLDGKVDSNKYIEMLSLNLNCSISKLNITEPIFQQDNAPCHTSRLTKEYFTLNNIKVMDWPAQSPDLNPIENIWGLLKTRLSVKKIKTLPELKESILEEWNKISPEETKKLVDSMRNRCISVIKARGGPTKY